MSHPKSQSNTKPAVRFTSLKRNLHRQLLAGAGAACALGTLPAMAADEAVEEIVVTGSYGIEKLSSGKHVRSLLDTAQTVSVVSDQMLIEQGRRTLRDSLRNITGISLQAGEGNPPGGGDSLNIRGFSARGDLYVDNLRDPGNYFRDPFNSESVEVTKGPSSVFSGRGNVGGAVNIVSRKPVLDSFISPELSLGTDDLKRGTVDLNHVLSPEQGIALRLNAMTHESDDPGRDHASSERWGFAPSLAWGLGGPTQVTLSYLHQEQDELPDFGLPNARNRSLANSEFAGAVAPVDRDNFYGYSTDYRDVEVDLVTLEFSHEFNDRFSLDSRLRRGEAHNDSIMSAPRFVGVVTTLDASTQVVGNRKPRDQKDDILVSQTDLTFNFNSGEFVHTLVTGFEFSREESVNKRRLDANGPATNLFNPVFQAAPPIAYNGTSAELETDVNSLYAIDSIELTPQWILTAGLRHDWVDTSVQSFDANGVAPAFVVDLSAEDSETSWNAALVYKPTPASSIYAAYSTSFLISGRSDTVQLAGGNNNAPVSAANFDVDPELSTGLELGAKYEVLDGQLALAAALFEVKKTDGRTPGINPGDPAVVLDGEQRVRGVELSAVGLLTERWNLLFGYTYLSGEVTESNRAFEEGQRLDNTPRHSMNLWTSYGINERLLIGGGVQYVDERTSNIPTNNTGNITITTDSYTVVDAFAEYRLSNSMKLRLNAYNLGDEEYYQSFSSGQSIPSAARALALSVNFEL